MSQFKKYRRKQIAELRPVTHAECRGFHTSPVYKRLFSRNTLYSNGEEVSISKADRKAGSPKIGDMIARNPKNHRDLWLVAEQYFKDNFEEIDE